ncbi:hypothetical protein BDW66DRAFT_79213 [Aspergillus desertorum]
MVAGGLVDLNISSCGRACAKMIEYANQNTAHSWTFYPGLNCRRTVVCSFVASARCRSAESSQVSAQGSSFGEHGQHDRRVACSSDRAQHKYQHPYPLISCKAPNVALPRPRSISFSRSNQPLFRDPQASQENAITRYQMRGERNCVRCHVQTPRVWRIMTVAAQGQ